MQTRPVPLVSILIPAYNAEAVLAATLDSALAQTWPNKEIIVVDDASTDGTAAVARAFADRGVVCHSRPRSGASGSRNFAYAQSRGEYIQFLDGDDLIAPNKIELQMRRLALAPGMLAACAWSHFSDDPQDGKALREPIWKDAEPLDWLICARGGGGMIPTGCWLTPRELVEAAGSWDESLAWNPDDDGEFFSRVVLASRGVCFCDDAHFHYRDPNGGNLRQLRRPESVRSMLETCHRYSRRMRTREDSKRTRRAAAYGYAQFLFTIHPTFPTQCDEAFAALEHLGSDFKYPGGARFRMLGALLGFRGALELRARLKPGAPSSKAARA